MHLKEGIDLLFIGMGVVFAFLILMVGLMHLCAAFFQRFAAWFPEPEVANPVRAAVVDDQTARIAVALAAAERRRRS